MEMSESRLRLHGPLPCRQKFPGIKLSSAGIVGRRRRKSEGGILGRPYAEELHGLERTYQWARRADLGNWCAALELKGLPLVAVGSGGSLSLAHYVARLNERFGGGLSRADTPLSLIKGSDDLRNTAVVVLSARGRNPDVLAVYRKVVQAEPKRLIVICSSVGSPLARLARKYDESSVLEFDSPAGKDGFLATNSLFATAILLLRTFASDEPTARLPGSYAELFPNVEARVQEALGVDGFLDRETLVTLHGRDTEVAGIDLESKLTEAALARVQLADFRNFAHGRHHWLAKRAGESAVLSFETYDDATLSRRTLDLIPAAVPRARLRIPHDGSLAGLASLVAVLHITGLYGNARSIDPGKPAVPPFGGRLYHLRMQDNGSRLGREKAKDAAIARKLGGVGAIETGLRPLFEERYEEIIKGLKTARIGALVLDYDGTICDDMHRFRGPDQKLFERLSKLIRSGLQVAFATGRGKSVRSSLRKGFDKELWHKIVVGYYNCAQTGPLSDETMPDTRGRADRGLKAAAQTLAEDKIISCTCEVTLRPQQITVASRKGVLPETTLWALVNEALARSGNREVQVVSSMHSVDILSTKRSKVRLLKFLREECDVKKEVLCIGDRGAWPGNDFWLLSQDFALSVDEVAVSPDSAWNLAPLGMRGSRALGFYLDGLRKLHGGFAFDLDRATRKPVR